MVNKLIVQLVHYMGFYMKYSRATVPLQAKDSWADETDPNLFPLQSVTASVD